MDGTVLRLKDQDRRVLRNVGILELFHQKKLAMMGTSLIMTNATHFVLAMSLDGPVQAAVPLLLQIVSLLAEMEFEQE